MCFPNICFVDDLSDLEFPSAQTMTITITYEPVAWILRTVLGFIPLIINAFILYKEWMVRKSDKTEFINKYLKIYSISSIICSVIHALFAALYSFNVFCYFGLQLTVQSFALQMVFMGLYQLERLRYCFSNSQVHSNKGYPNYIFFIMYIIAILWSLYIVVYVWLTTTPYHCGINNKYQLVVEYSSMFSLYPFMTAIGTIVYILWDLTTLFLYILKVLSFKRYKTENKNIYNRIMSILNRILILTITYEIVGIGLIISFVMRSIGNIHQSSVNTVSSTTSGLCASSSLNISMYLMQEHNKYQYKQYLFTIYKFRLHYICCCCCKSIINDEMVIYSDENKEEKGQSAEKYDSSIWETRNLSVKINRIGADALELSVETTTNM